jgi:hypothetical protein
LILDDIFSGLDAINEDRIFSRLLGKSGLLRQLRTTVILVTHAAHRLSYANQIIAISAEGTVSEQGKYDALIQNNGYVAGLAARRITEGDAPEENAPTKTKAADDTARLNAAADLYRPVGDLATYKYYFISLGWRTFAVWVGLMLCYSLLLSFPSRLFHPKTEVGANNAEIFGSSSGLELLLPTAIRSMVSTWVSSLPWNLLPCWSSWP